MCHHPFSPVLLCSLLLLAQCVADDRESQSETQSVLTEGPWVYEKDEAISLWLFFDDQTGGTAGRDPWHALGFAFTYQLEGNKVVVTPRYENSSGPFDMMLVDGRLVYEAEGSRFKGSHFIRSDDPKYAPLAKEVKRMVGRVFADGR